MKFLFYFFLFFISYAVSFSAFGLTEEPVFKITKKFKETKKEKPKAKAKKNIPLEFQRQSFSYSEDFVIYNEKAKSHLKSGTILKIYIPQIVIAGFNEEFKVYSFVISPIKAILSGKARAIKNTNKALIIFNEITYKGETKSIETFPVFLNGELKKSLFKDILLNFSDSLSSVLGLALKNQIPQKTGIHFISSDFKHEMSKLSTIQEKKLENKKLEYLEIKNINFLKVIVK